MTPSITPAKQTLTFMFTDIEGSTRLWEKHPEAMAADLARHQSIIESLVSAHLGEMVRERGEGDSTFSVFGEARDAVAAAASVQVALLHEPWRNPDGLRVRIALHTGAAVPYRHDFNSSAVNRCARLRSIAHGGQVLLTGACAELVFDDCPDGVALKDLGVHRLRDLERAERVYQVLHEALPSDFPPLKSESLVRDNLPNPATSFVGRRAELDEIGRLLSEATLLTLRGTGGVGKTRLAIQAAKENRDRFPDGVWFVDLSSVFRPADVSEVIVDTLRLPKLGGLGALSSLVSHFAGKTALLVLDNCEQLVEECVDVAHSLLRDCPNLKLLCTSREALGHSAEIVYRVPPLGIGEGGDESSAEAALLFLERASHQAAPIADLEGARAAVGRICARLDGIPLAIELAAARCRSMTLSEIEGHLDDRFALLTTGPRTVAPRQQTLQALFDWSYELLAEDERRALEYLSLFPGGWTLKSAAAVLNKPAVAAADLMDHLVEKSLIIASLGGGETRFRMLETVRNYFRRRLDESPHLAAAIEAQRSYLFDLAKSADQKIKAAHQDEGLAILAAEQENFREVLRLAAHDPMAAGPAIDICICIWHYWILRSQYAELRDQLLLFAEQAPEGTDPDTLASALTVAGVLASKEGDQARALSLHERSLALAQNSASLKQLSIAWNNIGLTHFYERAFDKADVAYQRSLESVRQLGDQFLEATTICNLGLNDLLRGEPDLALEKLDESLRIRVEIGDRYGQSISLLHRGNCLRGLGRTEEARREFERALELKRELGDREGEASVLSLWGELEREQGRFGPAFGRLGAALQIFEGLPAVRMTHETLDRLAVLLSQMQKDDLAARVLGCASSYRVASVQHPAEMATLPEALRGRLGADVYDREFQAGQCSSLGALLESISG